MTFETIIAVLKIVCLLILVGMLVDFWKWLRLGVEYFERENLSEDTKKSLARLEEQANDLADAWEEFYDKEYVPFTEKCEENFK